MNRFACQYAIVRFLPYAETGEFANVGVVLVCPATGYLDARVMPSRRTGRIAGFFEQLDTRIFREAMGYLHDELKRFRGIAQESWQQGKRGIAERMFVALIQPREALLRFSSARGILVEDPERGLEALFGRFVERDFASKDHHDQILERGVREVLRKADLRSYFHEGRIGNDDFYVNVPFLHEHNGRARLAIKPLDLAKDEPNKVFDVGGHWLERMRRLGKHGSLPQEVLFAVNLPDRCGGTYRAAEEILGELRDQGIKVAALNDTDLIESFAKRALSH